MPKWAFKINFIINKGTASQWLSAALTSSGASLQTDGGEAGDTADELSVKVILFIYRPTAADEASPSADYSNVRPTDHPCVGPRVLIKSQNQG